MIRFRRKFDSRKLKLVIFDLDGTLIDSRLDLIHSTNAMLRHCGRPELPGELIASYVGDGAPMLVRRALSNSRAAGPEEDAFFHQALEYFLAYYREHKLDNTHLYEGIEQALLAIRESRNHDDGQPLKMAVLSNKPVHPSRAIIEALGLNHFFVKVYGGDSFATKKPDPLGIRKLLEETASSPEDAMMVGDSLIDMQTGRNAELWTCGVAYGFDPKSLEAVPPDVVLEHPWELAELFSGSEPVS